MRRAARRLCSGAEGVDRLTLDKVHRMTKQGSFGCLGVLLSSEDPRETVGAMILRAEAEHDAILVQKLKDIGNKIGCVASDVEDQDVEHLFQILQDIARKDVANYRSDAIFVTEKRLFDTLQQIKKAHLSEHLRFQCVQLTLQISIAFKSYGLALEAFEIASQGNALRQNLPQHLCTFLTQDHIWPPVKECISIFGTVLHRQGVPATQRLLGSLLEKASRAKCPTSIEFCWNEVKRSGVQFDAAFLDLLVKNMSLIDSHVTKKALLDLVNTASLLDIPVSHKSILYLRRICIKHDWFLSALKQEQNRVRDESAQRVIDWDMVVQRPETALRTSLLHHLKQWTQRHGAKGHANQNLSLFLKEYSYGQPEEALYILEQTVEEPSLAIVPDRPSFKFVAEHLLAHNKIQLVGKALALYDTVYPPQENAIREEAWRINADSILRLRNDSVDPFEVLDDLVGKCEPTERFLEECLQLCRSKGSDYVARFFGRIEGILQSMKPHRGKQYADCGMLMKKVLQHVLEVQKQSDVVFALRLLLLLHQRGWCILDHYTHKQITGLMDLATEWLPEEEPFRVLVKVVVAANEITRTIRIPPTQKEDYSMFLEFALKESGVHHLY